jgi:hypothetical protein
VEFSVFNQIIFSDKTFATIRPIALKPTPGVYVLMGLQMWFLTEPFAAVIPIANVWLVCGTALVATVVRIVGVLSGEFCRQYYSGCILSNNYHDSFHLFKQVKS